MFTGIIQSLARVSLFKNGRLVLERPSGMPDLSVGESIAVDGVCLTLERIGPETLAFRLLPETARVTTLGRLTAGRKVHVERALKLGDRLGGHWLLGHVDAQAKLVSRRRERDSLTLEIAFPESLRPFLVPKGPVAMDGVSLTIGPIISGGRFSVYLVSHTLRTTHLGDKRRGDLLNLELDGVAKYLHGMLVT